LARWLKDWASNRRAAAPALFLAESIRGPYSRPKRTLLREGIVLAEIEQLLGLQGIDERLADADARRARLRGELERLRRQVEGERAAFAASREEVSRLRHDSRMKNLEVDDLDMQIRSYQKRLDEGIISFKEMEDLRTKIASERGRINRLEDEALALMEGLEAKTEEQRAAEVRLGEREAVLRQQILATETEIEEAGGKLDALAAEREAAATAMPSYLVSQYESLHAKYPDPVAGIRNGTCAGCKLRLSGNTTERVRGEMGIVTCEHCSRILYAA